MSSAAVLFGLLNLGNRGAGTTWLIRSDVLALGACWDPRASAQSWSRHRVSWVTDGSKTQ